MRLDLFFDHLWHRLLDRPYYLAKTIDEGQGVPVILLHGIGRTGQTWQRLVQYLDGSVYRAVAFDLLGFGASPKPDWLNYDIDDHSRAVIASIERLKLSQSAILVGHSMGCLVAVRVARLRPDLVRHLVLYEMPLIAGLPRKRSYLLRLRFYQMIFESAKRYHPGADRHSAQLADRLMWRALGTDMTEQTWPPFIRSLEHTIMEQTAPQDIKLLKMPADVIYGRLDMFVIAGKPREILGTDSELITAHHVRARHAISARASRFLVKRIQAATEREGLL